MPPCSEYALPETIPDAQPQQQQWKERPLPVPPSIFATLQSTQGSPSPPLVSQILTRGQKKRMEEEKAKRKLENVMEEVTSFHQTRSRTKKLTEATSKVGGNKEKKQKLDRDVVMGGTEEGTAGEDMTKEDKGKGKEIQKRMEEDTESELDGSDAELDPEEEEEDEQSELSDLDWPEEPEEPAIIYHETSDTVGGKA